MLSILLAAETAPRPLLQRVGDAGISLAQLWPLWLPILVGALAVYLLLPRPRAYPWFWGLLVGVLGLLLCGWLLVEAGVVWQETALFYAFAALAIVSGVLLVTQQNPARAALSFTLVVLASCGLFLLLAAPFLMAATIIVYAGAIVVTFLFVLMLAQPEGHSDADSRSREPLLATLTGFVLLATLLYVLKVGSGPAEVDRRLAAIKTELGENDPDVESRAAVRLYQDLRYNDLAERVENMENQPEEKLRAELDAALQEARRRYATERLVALRPAEALPVSDFSGPQAGAPRREVRRGPDGVPALPAENAAYLGRSLFTDYLLPVELGGFLLLVATVGAVAIGQRREKARSPREDGPALELERTP